MKLSDIMGHAGLSVYAEVALLLFFAAFLGIVWWVFRRPNLARWTEAARLPLDEPLARPADGRGGHHDG